MPNGGTACEASIFDVGSATFVTPIPARDHYRFDGWYETVDFSTDKVTHISTGTSKNIVLYAKWIAEDYTIVYDSNGGSKCPNDSYTIEEAITLPTPTRTHYTFEGWYQNSTFTGTALKKIVAGSNGDLILYAKWTPKKYSVTYYTNGGNALDPLYYSVENNGLISLTDSTMNGATFDGWYESADFTTERVTTIDPQRGENISLYAKWNPIQYKIAYESMGGSNCPNDEYNIYTELSLPVPVREFHRFDGWYTNKSYTGTRLYSIPVGSYGDKTLYAKWIGAEYEVFFNANGGYFSTPNEITVSDYVNYGESYSDLPIPICEGHNFVGWYTSSTGGTKVDSNTQVIKAQNHTLYAHWEKKNYPIRFDYGEGSGSVTEKTIRYQDA